MMRDEQGGWVIRNLVAEKELTKASWKDDIAKDYITYIESIICKKNEFEVKRGEISERLLCIEDRCKLIEDSINDTMDTTGKRKIRMR